LPPGNDAAALRVLSVDDTVTYRRIVTTALEQMPGVEIVGAAANGRIALQRIEQLRPDLVTLDLEMPDMSGLDVLRRLQEQGLETGVIILSAHSRDGADVTLQGLALGAFDFVVKPSGGDSRSNAEKLLRELRQRIEAYARTREIHRILRPTAEQRRPAPRTAAVVPPPVQSAPKAERPSDLPLAVPPLVALGISTGGPQALTQMLPQLPANLPAPMLIVQHMPAMFTRSLADDLNRRCALRVREAQDGEPVLPGAILIAPGGRQMKIAREAEQTVVRITDDPPENSCQPSVDYLFRSVAEIYGPRSIGVLMTGMGSDGVAGCRLLHRRGATILAQDEASCVVFGMPRDPIEEGIARPVALGDMAAAIVRLLTQGATACR